ncbi:AMP-binding protein [Rhodoplanes roseus]|uniref:Fatty-acid--CoA ligase n=1 Tax=Rhodoplanes roseus TaxID=29409 RepID=A0A327L5J8_9BRAD|nr:AMP-binding protein [Rhodoplanes roseus]RAI45851.1 fatty-acid--CoA ligase [Rhodoplanes roseus]
MNGPAGTLADALARNAARHGDAEALVTATARLTWRALDADVRRAARALLAMGVRKGDHVGLLFGNDETWVTLFFAAATIGAVTVPVNTRFKAAELGFCLKQADVTTLILTDHFLGIDFVAYLREAEPAVDAALPGTALPRLGQVVVRGEQVPAAAQSLDAVLARGDAVSDQDLAAAAAEVGPDDLLLIQFTSGTTAFPKGVMLTHANMLCNAAAVAARMGVTADDRYFNCRPFFHVAGSTLSLLVSLVTGCCLATLPTFEAGAALAMMEAERCTLTSGNDTLFQLMMGHPDFATRRLSLRGGWCAAGPETMRNIVERMGARDLCWAYGLSEASPNVVFSDRTDPLDRRIEGAARPHPGVTVRIAGPDGAPVPAGQSGEIQVRGWNVMRGYYDNPEATAAAFTADGWLRTGDVGAVDQDGWLRLIGRIKDVFRVGGENVAPAEVEEVLLAHPAVATAQVVGVPDTRLGEVPAAFVTLKSGEVTDEAELIGWTRQRCANFRVPRYLRIVDDFEAIGMTASGKVQKARLRAHAVAAFGLG